MFDDDNEPRHMKAIQKNLETMSIDELNEYIGELENEIVRVKADMDKKKASMDAASSVFK